MTENGLFVLGGPETQLHDILWAVHNGKNRGRSEGEENIVEFPVMVGGRGRAVRVSLVRMRVCARHWALTEPKRGIRLLNPSDCTAGYALLNLIEPFLRSLLLLSKADRTCCLLPLMNSECCWGIG